MGPQDSKLTSKFDFWVSQKQRQPKIDTRTSSDDKLTTGYSMFPWKMIIEHLQETSSGYKKDSPGTVMITVMEIQGTRKLTVLDGSQEVHQYFLCEEGNKRIIFTPS